jgi:hypothetical protein
MVIRNGNVALQQFSPNNLPKRIDVGGVEYTPTLQNNVILVWVPEAFGEQIINSDSNFVSSCNCGNGAKKPLFFYATDINVSIFETGTLP